MEGDNQVQPESADRGFNSCLLRALPWALLALSILWAGSVSIGLSHERRVQSAAMELRLGMEEARVRQVLAKNGLSLPKEIDETDLPLGFASLIIMPFSGPLTSLKIRLNRRGRLVGVSTVRHWLTDEQDGPPWPLAP